MSSNVFDGGGKMNGQERVQSSKPELLYDRNNNNNI